MGFIYQEWRIVVASALALVMVVGAFLLAEGGGNAPVAQAATESALLAEVANRDSTGDGLPDWEKPLYGIPLNATTTDYFNLGMTDGEAVAKGLIVPIASADIPAASSTPDLSPNDLSQYGITETPAEGSLTSVFAQNFFALYVSAEQQNNGSLTDDQINDVANQALTELSDDVSPAPDFKTAADINVSGSGSAALIAYAEAAESIISVHSAGLPESELTYLQDYVNGDTTALDKLNKISVAYTDTATGLATLVVPQEAAAAQLALVNSMARLGAIIHDLSLVNSDPLTALLALDQYGQTVTDLGNAFAGVSQVFSTANVTIPLGAPGAYFVNFINTLPTASSTPQ